MWLKGLVSTWQVEEIFAVFVTLLLFLNQIFAVFCFLKAVVIYLLIGSESRW